MMIRLLIAILLATLLADSSLAEEKSEFHPSLECSVRHSYGIFGGYSKGPVVGEKVTINLEKLSRSSSHEQLKFPSGAYVPFMGPLKKLRTLYYSEGSVSSQRFRADSGTQTSIVIGVQYGVSGERDARATVHYEKDEVLGIIFLDCDIVEKTA